MVLSSESKLTHAAVHACHVCNYCTVFHFLLRKQCPELLTCCTCPSLLSLSFAHVCYRNTMSVFTCRCVNPDLKCHTHTHTHTYIRSYTHRRAHTPSHIHTRTCTHRHAHTHTRTHMHTHAHGIEHVKMQPSDSTLIPSCTHAGTWRCCFGCFRT